MPQTTVTVTNLAQYGIVPDATFSTLPPNAFSFGRNWRFNTAGFTEVTRGYTDAYGAGLLAGVDLGDANTVATFVHTFTLQDSPAIFYYDATARRMRIAEIDTTTNTFTESDISTAQHPMTVEHEWQSTSAFGVPIFNNGEEAPWEHFLNNGADELRTLTNWPAGATCEYLTTFGVYLIAIGYQNTGAAAGEQGGRRVIAISDAITTPGTLPQWNFANTDSHAQLFDLSLHTEGDLVSAYEQNNILYINTTTNVIALEDLGMGQFSATDLPFPHGVLTKRVTALVPNGQFNIGNRKMFIHDGNNATLIGEGTFVETWFATLDNDRLNEVQTIYDPRTSSIWIKTPVSGTEQQMWIYNLENNTLAILDDHQEVEYMFFSAEGIPDVPVTWDGLSGSWDGIPLDSWNEFPSALGGASFRNRVLSVGARKIFVHDEGANFNGRAFTATLRREDLPVGESYSSGTINRIVPWVSSEASGQALTVRVGGSNTPASTVTYTPTQTLAVDTGEKLDFRTTVKWAAIEFTASTSRLRLSGYDMSISLKHRR